MQGALYEAALPTAACLASALITCQQPARPLVLELLAQIARGEPHPDEVLHGNGSLRETCLIEISRAFSVYVGLLDIAQVEELEHCIDLIAFCALNDESLKDRARWYFNKLRASGIAGGQLAELIDNWLLDLA